MPAGITASTGIAATHIGGVTIHSWSGVGIKDTLDERDIEHLVSKNICIKDLKTKVLVIDEVSMLSSRLFDSVERVCRAMKRNERTLRRNASGAVGRFFSSCLRFREGGETEFIHKSEAWGKMDSAGLLFGRAVSA